MLEAGQRAPSFSLPDLDGREWRRIGAAQGKPELLIFFETDCPTCVLALPYLNSLAESLGRDGCQVVGISQDAEGPTRHLVQNVPVRFPVVLDRDLSVSRRYDPVAVPTLFLLDGEGRIIETLTGFDKEGLNALAVRMGKALGQATQMIARRYDGAP